MPNWNSIVTRIVLLSEYVTGLLFSKSQTTVCFYFLLVIFLQDGNDFLFS